ncbi:N-formylglutamate amidohydrolase [Legionella fairfieldensis]|uniref:N-formylglutamate amidohydrolase n=1 Tax=Legionella fairfieldensis TaxID=45064 RepID=UPI00048E1B4F|nr:N-formylglutamate amidohydrolase [Legionella fairfieldensis]
MKPTILLLTCEHAVNTIPEAYQSLFAPYQQLLLTHRGVDLGALTLATHLKHYFSCELIEATISRLVIDCNRSLSHRHCFSEITKSLSSNEKNQIIKQYYLPFRQQVEQWITQHTDSGYSVLHLSIHSFTPVLNNIPRAADLGLLYDPKRPDEKWVARQWQKKIRQHNKELRVRLNYPYLGINDGFTTTLRKQFNNDLYAGIEVESNQITVMDNNTCVILAHTLTSTLTSLLNEMTL